MTIVGIFSVIVIGYLIDYNIDDGDYVNIVWKNVIIILLSLLLLINFIYLIIFFQKFRVHS